MQRNYEKNAGRCSILYFIYSIQMSTAVYREHISVSTNRTKNARRATKDITLRFAQTSLTRDKPKLFFALVSTRDRSWTFFRNAFGHVEIEIFAFFLTFISEKKKSPEQCDRHGECPQWYNTKTTVWTESRIIHKFTPFHLITSTY